jgi:CDP-glycerol glycerophosphotransferase (TagB/SpsB family)
VLVCDTSSVIPECVVQGKPVVTFHNRAPQPWMLDIDTPDQLDGAIDRALAADGRWHAALAQEAARIHPWRDGRSSERVIAATEDLLAGRLGTLAPKPRNLWRKLRIRWDLGWLGPGG